MLFCLSLRHCPYSYMLLVNFSTSPFTVQTTTVSSPLSLSFTTTTLLVFSSMLPFSVPSLLAFSATTMTPSLFCMKVYSLSWGLRPNFAFSTQIKELFSATLAMRMSVRPTGWRCWIGGGSEEEEVEAEEGEVMKQWPWRSRMTVEGKDAKGKRRKSVDAVRTWSKV